MENEASNSELINLVNQALNVEELNEKEMVLRIKKLKELNPNFELKLNLEMRCQGYCLENKNQQLTLVEQLCYIPNHKEHSVCYTCMETWVLSNFYECPLNSIYCQRCVFEGREIPLEITVHYITQNIIPLKIYNTYINYYTNKNYVICYICAGYINNSSVIKLSCGHNYCQKDLVSYNLNYYYKLVKEAKTDLPETIEFQLVCSCGIQEKIDPTWNNHFNSYTESLLPYLNTRNFYTKYKSFFTLESKFKLKACCKKYKLTNSVNKECLHCSRCALMDHPIHTGLSCEEFINLPKKYEIEYEPPIFTKNGKVPKLNPLILSNISEIEKIYKVKNMFMEVATRFKRVWEYGFLYLKDLESVKELFENKETNDNLEIFSTFVASPGNKFVVFCEVNGFEILRDSAALDPSTQRPVIIEDSKLKVHSRDQIRYLYLAQLS